MTFQLAPMAPADRRFVGQNWLRGRCGLPTNKHVPGDVCVRWEYGAICEAMTRCQIEMLTAGESPRPVGFRASENIGNMKVLHWVYVEPLSRRQGAASAMLVGYQAHSAESASTRRLGALAGAYVPYLWAYPDKAWELCTSSGYHKRQFVTWAEELSTL